MSYVLAFFILLYFIFVISIIILLDKNKELRGQIENYKSLLKEVTEEII